MWRNRPASLCSSSTHPKTWSKPSAHSPPLNVSSSSAEPGRKRMVGQGPPKRDRLGGLSMPFVCSFQEPYPGKGKVEEGLFFHLLRWHCSGGHCWGQRSSVGPICLPWAPSFMPTWASDILLCFSFLENGSGIGSRCAGTRLFPITAPPGL